jgi:cytoskeletal protein CcmA (bactofilin family)
MPDEVPSRAVQTLGTVQGDLTTGDGAIIRGEGTPPKVTVLGAVHCRGDCMFESSLSAQSLEGDGYIVIKGDLEVKDHVKIGNGFGFHWGEHAKAQLVVEGNVHARTIDVDSKLSVGKDLNAETVEVGGKLEVRGKTKAEDIDVGGSFSSTGEVEAENVDVGGAVHTESKVKIEKLDVGGSAKVAGGSIDDIDVGGSFASSDSLQFQSIDVGGAVRLAGKNAGGDIDVGGV